MAQQLAQSSQWEGEAVNSELDIKLDLFNI